MVIRDRIRLTGLLRKKPWQRGFFYCDLRYGLVTVSVRQPFGGLFRNRSARAPGFVPASLRPAAARLAVAAAGLNGASLV